MRMTDELLEEIKKHKNYAGNNRMLDVLYVGMRIKRVLRGSLMKNGLIPRVKK